MTRQTRVLLHIVAWLAYFLLLAFFFTTFLDLIKGMIIAFGTVCIHGMLFYLNSEWLIPRLLKQKKHILYVFSLVVLMTFGTALNYVQDQFFGFRDFERGKPHLALREGSPSQGERPLAMGKLNPFQRSFFKSFYSLIAILMLSTSYRLLLDASQKERREVSLQNENLQTELKFLKSQINPHFLFNSLNNIYTLVYLKHDNAPAMLLKLSEMLRYMIYESNGQFVPIKKEIEYINNVIGLQTLKTELPQNIDVQMNIQDDQLSIPPLILVPFIENSFKHSKIEDTDSAWVKIKLETSEEQLSLKVENTKPKSVVVKDKVGGIGLENVKRRLELTYPKKHELILNQGNVFSVSLKIALK